MSLKAELEIWASALAAYDAEKFEEALDLFSRIADSSKIFTNIGLIYATLGDHETAVEQFFAATQLDQYLAVAYFQCGVSNFLLTRYDRALKDFEEALMYLRGNQAINYEQLGLKFKLYSAEILFNRGLSLIYLGRVDEGLADMEDARRERKTDEHAVIDEAIQDKGQGYTVFSIPVGVLYRPSENKLKNAKQKDYMGKAKLVASEDANDAYTTFSGATRLRQGITPQGVFVDDLQPPSDLTRSVTVPPPRTTSDPIAPAALQRSKTTIAVSDYARDRIKGLTTTPTPRPGSPPEGSGNGRVETSIPVTRGLSIRKSTAPSKPAIKQEQRGDDGVTEFYDDYIDSYRSSPRSASRPPLPTIAKGSERTIASWAKNSANPNNHPLSRAASMGSSSYSPGVRRRPTRSNTVRLRSRRNSTYEEEEGYASGDYNDGSVVYELAKIRVKVHYKGEVRGMTVTLDMPFEEFMDRLSGKFGLVPKRLDVKFKDEDGGKVSLKDESDYDMAIETAKEAAQGKAEGRLEVWCTDAY